MVSMGWRMVLFSRSLLFRQCGMAALSPRYGAMKGMASAVSASPRPLSVNMMVRPKKLDNLRQLVEDGAITLRVAETFKPEDAPAAHRRLEAGGTAWSAGD